MDWLKKWLVAHRYLVPIVVCFNLGWWWLLAGFITIYLLDRKVIQSKLANHPWLNLSFLVTKYGIMFQLLKVLSWFLVREKIPYVIFLFYLAGLFILLIKFRRILVLNAVQSQMILIAFGAIGLMILFFQTFLANDLSNPFRVLALLALFLEWSLIVSQVIKYEKKPV